ncbi:hypothetical protein ACI65C_002011 [Semiaphis heraclei]
METRSQHTSRRRARQQQFTRISTAHLASSGSRRPANFFTLTTTTTTSTTTTTTTTTMPYQMSRGPPTTPPVGLARKRRTKRNYDKFGIIVEPDMASISGLAYSGGHGTLQNYVPKNCRFVSVIVKPYTFRSAKAQLKTKAQTNVANDL